jgi:ATP-binding cassette subfamily B protein
LKHRLPNSRPTLRRLVDGHHRALAVLSVASLVGGGAEAGLLGLTGLAAFSIATDAQEILGPFGGQVSIDALLFLAGFLLAVRLVVELIVASGLSRLMHSVGIEARSSLMTSYLESSWALKQNEPAGQLQHLVLNFSRTGMLLIQDVVHALTAIVSILGMLTIALLIHPVATAIVVVALALFASLMIPLRRLMGARAELAAGAELEVAREVSSIGRMGLELQSFGVTKHAIKHLDQVAKKEAITRQRVDLLNLVTSPIYTTLAYTFLILGIGCVVVLDLEGLDSIGAVMLIMLRSLAYGQRLQTSISSIAERLPSVDSLDAELDRYREAKVTPGSVPVDSLEGIQVSEVCFHYLDNEPVLNDITFHIQRGETIGVIGASGSGKTTLTHLLLGLRTPSHGNIRLGKTELADISQSDWSSLVAFVPQEPLLLSGTVASNVRFFRNSITDDQIVRALHSANFVGEEGQTIIELTSEVGEGGSNLSGGQRQRVAIARAIAGQPQLLVLDEPTSALDAQSESLVRKALADLRGDVTMVIVSHRHSTLEICDRVMIIESGCIANIGPTNEIIHFAENDPKLALDDDSI